MSARLDQPGATPAEPRRLLILQSHGRMSRYWLEGLVAAARRRGIEHRVMSYEALVAASRQDQLGLMRQIRQVCARERIGAVLGYTLNGLFELPLQPHPERGMCGFFESLDIPQLMFWSDHPQWASKRMGLQPETQPALASPLIHHFVKSEAAARELSLVLGWPSCHAMPVAEDPEMVRPTPEVTPDVDIVTISGSAPQLDPRLLPLLDQSNPDLDVIRGIAADAARLALQELWDAEVPSDRRPDLDRLAAAWLERRREDTTQAAIRHFEVLRPAHAAASAWLLDHPTVYFRAARAMWSITGWQRTFITAHLARRFSLRLHGSDWSSVGVESDPQWVDHHDQGAIYARGRLALTIAAGHDEEGLTHKPHQIAASGRPMVILARRGLDTCYEPDREAATFTTPAEAAATVDALLRNPDRATALADAAWRRVHADHGWDDRLAFMMTRSGLDIADFRSETTHARAA